MMPFFKIVLLYFPCAVGWWFIGVILVALSINILCRISPKFAVWCYTRKQRKDKQKNERNHYRQSPGKPGTH